MENSTIQQPPKDGTGKAVCMTKKNIKSKAKFKIQKITCFFHGETDTAKHFVGYVKYLCPGFYCWKSLEPLDNPDALDCSPHMTAALSHLTDGGGFHARQCVL